MPMTEADKRYNAIQRMNRTAVEYGYVVKSERENTLARDELLLLWEQMNRGWKKLEEAEEQITKLREANKRLKMNDAIDAQREEMRDDEQCDVITRQMAEIAELKSQLEAEKAKNAPINFDDANYEFFWAAENGDVVFWKVPVALYALPFDEENDDGSRVQEAFHNERFGEEWGCLSSHSIRTMDLAILEENE